MTVISLDSCLVWNWLVCLDGAVILAAGHIVWNVLLIIAGLPPTGSWQDLKDHMREAGDICYADVFHDGTGVVEFVRYEDMKYAMKKLDDTKFKSHEVSTRVSYYQSRSAWVECSCPSVCLFGA